MGPLEIEINQLNKEIEECNSEAMTLQKHWLNEQKELVKLTQEREEQKTSLDTFQKQIIIMQQRKLRVESSSFPNSPLKSPTVKGGKGSAGLQMGKAGPAQRVLLAVCEQEWQQPRHSC